VTDSFPVPEIPGYVIEREIGVGGMARVYLGTQISLDRKVALKVMAPALVADPAFSKRFLREARTLAGLTHPNIVAVYDVGATESLLHYFAMQHLDNGDLVARIQRGMAEPELVRIVTGISRALGFAHQRGVVHRDVTPGNIMFDSAENPVLTDFGIARSQHGSTRITHTGVSIGTSSYMSPEQARGGEVDQRSDLYSLGALLFEALTGHPPYRGADGFAVAYAHVFEPIPRLPNHVAHWQSFIDKVLAKDPSERFDNAEQFAMALSDVPVQAARVVPQRSLARPQQNSGPTVALAQLDERAIAPIKQAIAPVASDRPTVTRGQQNPVLANNVATPPIPATDAQKIVPAKPLVKANVQSGPVTLSQAVLSASDGAPKSKLPIILWCGAILIAGLAGAGYWYLKPPAKSAVAITPSEVPISTTPIPAPVKPGQPPVTTASTNAPPTETSNDPTATDTVPNEWPSDPALVIDPNAPKRLTEADVAEKYKLGSNVGPPTRAMYVKPWLDLGLAASKKDQCFVAKGAIDWFRLTLATDPSNAQAAAGIASCFGTIAAKVDAVLALDASSLDLTDTAKEFAIFEKFGAQGGAKSKEALLVAAEKQRLIDAIVARAPPFEKKWQTSAARLIYNEVLKIDAKNALALAGLKRIASLGQPKYVFSDALKSGGKAASMVIIGAGTVSMSDARGAKIKVEIEQNFAVARTEVSVADYRRFVSASGHRGSGKGCNNMEGFALFVSKDRTWEKPGFEQTNASPVTCVDFNDAKAYVRWLSGQTGESYRLLSEAEWQLVASSAAAPACKSGNHGDQEFGDQFKERAVYSCKDGFAATAPAGKFGANAQGVQDLVGNVREWVEDCWNASIAARPKNAEPWLGGNCAKRVAMGTAWISKPAEKTTQQRTDFDQDARNNTVGFRVARNVLQVQ
jgi:serine/threonine-protein kinase PpkA